MQYVYIFVRKDLTKMQKAVQAIHAGIETGRNYYHKLDDHPTVVLLGVKDEKALVRICDKLEKNCINFSPFIEPDLNDSLTAVATELIEEDQRHLFKKYDLLK